MTFDFASDLRDRRDHLELIARESGASFTDDKIPLSTAKRAFERWLIRVRLAENNGNIAAAARSLSMDRGQLSRLVKRHDIDKNNYKNSQAD